jgi:hypothetical protein
MSLEKIFSLCGMLATVGWLLLVFLPRWKWTARLVCPGLIPLLLALIYLWLVATTFGRTPGGFGSLADVSLLFQNPRALLAGWIHYLAFDLFIGSWEVRDAQRVGLHHLLVVPCLVLTFLFGPVGLLLYFALRAALKRRVSVGGEAS